jgi:hypothetical protein
VEKCGRAREATDGNMAHALCMLANEGYRHTLSICNTYYFSTATIVTRRHLSVMFICTLPLLCFNLIYRANLQISYSLLLYLCAECGAVSPNVDSKRYE